MENHYSILRGLDELTFDDHVVEELLVKYPPLSVADIRDIVFGAYVKGSGRRSLRR